MASSAQKVAKRLEQREDVQFALEQAAGGDEASAVPRTQLARRDRAWIGVWGLLLGVVVVAYLCVWNRWLPLPPPAREGALRVARGIAVVMAILAAERVISLLVIARMRDPVSRYNLHRIADLVAVLAAAFIGASILFRNWYTAIVSLGLISLILGFALQTPITSLLAWIYILVRRPFRVGDRIRIGQATGDVIDVSYLDTTLWEFGGEYLSTDHPSGRLIKFPNSNVLTTPVYNYSWPLFPYIWNEVKFHLAYDSDLEWVAATIKEVAEQEVGEQMTRRVLTYRELLAKTPVDHLEVREEPAVFFRVNDNTWLEVILRYLVDPKQAGRVKNRLIQELLRRLTAEPERAKFPKSNMR
ncbi:MAG TPA: mechanosensitive ion channel family protein [Thermoanaerobaculia bacterium]|jgi:small-conductance mechanosensitive channel|nr:mechanosensitive ion channel family protein [Thermoanaerobaculia bacterium]